MKLQEIRTYSIYSKLANVLAEKGFSNMPEIENIIENYFKLWLSDLKDDTKYSNHIVEERNKIYTEIYALEIKWINLKKQLSDATENLRRGEEVDILWMNKARTALNIVNGKILKCKNKLTNLKTTERQHNIDVQNIKEKKMLSKLHFLLKEERGEDYTKQLFEKAKLKIDEEK